MRVPLAEVRVPLAGQRLAAVAEVREAVAEVAVVLQAKQWCVGREEACWILSSHNLYD